MKQVRSTIALLWIMVLVLSRPTQGHAQTKSNPVAEKWIIAQLARGAIADLKVPFKNEKDRVISGSFLDTLLNGLNKNLVVHRRGIRIWNAVFVDPISLSSSSVRYNIWLARSTFQQPVDLSRATFSGSLDLGSSSFKKGLNISSVKINGDMFLHNCDFHGPSDFGYGKISGTFELDGSRFQGPQSTADFDGLKVGQALTFLGVVFDSSVNFGAAEIKGQINGNGARFNSPSSIISFNGIKVGGGVFLRDAVFNAGVDFAASEIAVNLEADRVQFLNPNSKAVFNGMKVAHMVVLNNATFNGAADFEFAHIGSNFYCIEIRFATPRSEADFGGANISGALVLNSGFFGGFADFTKVEIKTQIALHNTIFNDRYTFKGMSYGDFYIGEEKDSWSQMLKLIQRSSFDASTYANFESVLKQTGHPDAADETFIAGKRRERADLSIASWLGSVFLDCAVGYGRRPSRVIYWSLLFIAIGSAVFNKKYMVYVLTENNAQPFNRIIYSIEAFVPFVDLFLVKAWRPKPRCTLQWRYLWFCRIVGWILVPVAVAAWTGLIG